MEIEGIPGWVVRNSYGKTIAAGGLYSTVENLYRWDQALYTDKLSPKNLRDMMFTPFALTSDNGELGYGYGWVIGRKII